MSDDTQSNESTSESTSCCCSGKCSQFIFSDLTWAMLMLRLWIGLRMLLAGFVKFRDISPQGTISVNLENYYGKPGDAASGWINHASEPFYKYGGLPEPMAKLYTGSLGWMMLLGGIMILLGLTNRLALIFGACVFLSLSFGLMTLDDSQEIAYVAAQFALFVGALALSKHNRLLVLPKF